MLERISPVIEADARNADIAGNAVLSRIDPANETVLRTLLYFCYHHWATAENLLQSPAALRKVPQGPVVKENPFRNGPKNSPFAGNPSKFPANLLGIPAKGLFFGPFRNGFSFTTGPSVSFLI